MNHTKCTGLSRLDRDSQLDRDTQLAPPSTRPPRNSRFRIVFMTAMSPSVATNTQSGTHHRATLRTRVPALVRVSPFSCEATAMLLPCQGAGADLDLPALLCDPCQRVLSTSIHHTCISACWPSSISTLHASVPSGHPESAPCMHQRLPAIQHQRLRSSGHPGQW